MSLAQAGFGAVQTVAGAIGTAKANRELKANSKLRPEYHIAKPILDNQAIAESRASRGLNDNTINNYNSFTERNLTATLDAALKGGSAMNNIGDVFTAADEGERKLAILDDEMNARNVQNLIAQNREMGGELDKQFQFNEVAPWADKQKALMAKLEKNQQGVNNGLNTMFGAGANYVTGKQYEKEIDSVYGPKTDVNKVMQNLDNILDTPQPGSSRRTNSVQEDLRIKFPGLIGSGYQIR